jgi:hypothetical protein
VRSGQCSFITVVLRPRVHTIDTGEILKVFLPEQCTTRTIRADGAAFESIPHAVTHQQPCGHGQEPEGPCAQAYIAAGLHQPITLDMQDQLRGTERGNDPGDSQPNAVIHARASKVAPQRLQAMYPGGTGRNIAEAPGEGDEGALIGSQSA